MWNARLDEAQPGIKIAGRNINHLRYAEDTTMAESEEKLNSLLMKVKEESENISLKHSIQKTGIQFFAKRCQKIMASSPITPWQIDRETMGTVTDFISLGSKITADVDCSHEMKRCLLLGRKAMTNLDCILISRDITLLTKFHLVKAMVFPVVMYGCGSWTIKKAEGQIIDAFKLWCWRRLLRVPWTAWSSNQWILKEISPEYSLEGLMLKLKSNSLAKNWLILGWDWRQEQKGMTEDEMVGWHHRLDGHMFEHSPVVGDGQGSCCVAVHAVTRCQTLLRNWIELMHTYTHAYAYNHM